MSERQISAWRGAFGDAYTGRNAVTEERILQRVRAFAEILGRVPMAPPTSILEAGCNVGINLRALRRVTTATLHGLEPNARARQTLVDDGVLEADHVLDATLASIPLPDASVDLAFTSGVLIHVPEEALDRACSELHRVSRRYIACIEYFAPTPEIVRYRGEEDLLFKRDFGDHWLTLFPSMRVVGTGFFWRRTTGLDNLTWWLFEKS